MTRSTQHSPRWFTPHLALLCAAVAAAAAFPAGAADRAPAVAASAAQPATSPEVTISNFTFQPALLTVKAGTRVTWTNRDTTPHTVTSTDKRFESSAGLDTNDRYSYVFGKAGTYEYFCSLHPMMVGKVVVSEP